MCLHVDILFVSDFKKYIIFVLFHVIYLNYSYVKYCMLKLIEAFE